MATRGLSDPVWYDHGAVLRPIPAGDVHLSALDDRPTHVDAFLLDAAPVTVRRYARFFARVGRHIAEPLEWATQLLTPDAPVTGVAPDDAAAFAASVGGRLPTLWEWQRVARARAGLASPQHAEPFGVTGLCLRWEWTETPAPSGFWVCGGRYRDRPDERPGADHLAFESRAAVDVGFRVARDLAAAITPPPPTAPGPEPLLLDEPTRVTSASRQEVSSTAPEGEVPPPDPLPDPTPPPAPPRSPPTKDETLAAQWATPPRATWRCGDVIVLDALSGDRPILEQEHRALWLGRDGSRWPAGLTAMWSEAETPPRLEARLLWHALREGCHPPTNACAFHVVDVHEGVMPVFIERVTAGVPLRELLDELARREESGRLPFEVGIAFALHVVERAMMPGELVLQDDIYGRGRLAWDGTWHPSSDVVAATGRGSRMRGLLAVVDGAPEAVSGRPLDGSANVHRAGILLYRLLTGTRPWAMPAEPSFVPLMQAALRGERRSIRVLRPDLPEAVARVVDAAVAVDRGQRTPTLDLLCQQWRELLEPGFDRQDAVIDPARTATFMAGLVAECFPLTRAAELEWWEQAGLVDVDLAVPSPTATPVVGPPPSVERWHAAIRAASARQAART